MRATETEFRHRFWIFTALYVLAFLSSAFDPRTLAATLVASIHGAGFEMASAAGRNELRALSAAAAALLVAAALVRTWAAAYLTSDVVNDEKLHAEALVADGPYRHLRNPLYLGTILMAVGIAPFAPPLGATVLILGVSALVLRLIGLEESRLLAAAPERYAAFRARVPRLLPALRARLPVSGRRPRWPQAFAGESLHWLIAAGALAVAVTLDERWLGGFALAGVVANRLAAPPARAHADDPAALG